MQPLAFGFEPGELGLQYLGVGAGLDGRDEVSDLRLDLGHAAASLGEHVIHCGTVGAQQLARVGVQLREPQRRQHVLAQVLDEALFRRRTGNQHPLADGIATVAPGGAAVAVSVDRYHGPTTTPAAQQTAKQRLGPGLAAAATVQGGGRHPALCGVPQILGDDPQGFIFADDPLRLWPFFSFALTGVWVAHPL